MVIHRFRTLIFFVTSKCNARCITCFYWGNLNKIVDELNIEEINLISCNLGKFDILQISGGEPFLRDDLDKICEIFYKNNKIKGINIPTNCLLSEKISRVTEKILQLCPAAIVVICCALDGIGNVHDKIRGVEGNFEKVKITVTLLKELERKYPNLSLIALTTLCKDNYAEYDKISKFVKEELKIEHNVDVVRQNTPKDKEIENVPMGVIKKIHKERLRDIYSNSKYSIFRRIILVGLTKIFDKIHEDTRERRKWPLICCAGINIAVLEPNGEVKLCEQGSVVGNVREKKYNIYRVLNNKKARDMRKAIIESHCSCDNRIFISETVRNSIYHKIIALIKGLINCIWLR